MQMEKNMDKQWKHRLTVTSGVGVDVTLEARRICDFLFTKCGGNVSEEAVLMYLRRCKHQHEKFPHTKPANDNERKD